MKQLIRHLKGTQHTCLRLEPREMVQKGLLEIVGRGDSDWAGDSATRQSVAGHHCNVQGVTMCNRSLKQRAVGLSSCEAEFYAASACTGELLGLAEFFKEHHYDVAVRLEMDSDSARHILQRRGPGGLKTHRNSTLGNTTGSTRETCIRRSSGHEEQTPQISSRNIWMDCEHSRLRRSLGFESWMVQMVRMQRTRITEEW